MAEIDELSVVISLIDRFSSEITQMISKIESLEAAVERVDGKTLAIDVDLRDDEQALSQIAALRAASTGGTVDVGGGGGGIGAVQTRQLGQIIKQLGSLDMDMGESIESTTQSLSAMTEVADEASEGFKVTNLRMSDMHNALAKLIPLILVFIGAMPAIIGGLVALATAAFAAAAALVALAGFGALGFALAREGDFLQNMKDVFQQLQDAFMDAFAPLAKRLEPMFEGFISGLESLFHAIAEQGDVLLALRDDARAFGEFMLDTIPHVIAQMGRLADVFSGVFGVIIDMFRDTNIFKTMADFMAEALPSLRAFGALVIELIKNIIGLSIGFIQLVNVVLGVINAFFALANALGVSDKLLGFIIATGLTLVTVLSVLFAVVKLNLVAALASLGQSLVAATFEMIAFGSAGISLSGIISALTAETLAWAAATAIATAGLSVLLGLASMMIAKWATTGDKIRSATQELKRFNQVGNRLGGQDNPFAEPALTGRLTSGGGGGNVNITIQGNADEEVVRETAWNAMIRGRNK